MPLPAFLAAAGPYILGALSTGGAMLTNRANSRAAREQMSFQERMSSTAAQRSVVDFTRAGLNPALAYERTASSPGGASATVGDPIASGIATAQAARAMKQQMAFAAQQNKADLELKTANEELALTQAESAWSDVMLKRQQHEFNRTTQPYHSRAIQADATLKELMLPGARNTADWENRINTSPLRSAKTLSEILKTLNPRRF